MYCDTYGVCPPSLLFFAGLHQPIIIKTIREVNLFGYADSLLLKMLICDPDKMLHSVIIVLSIIADYHHGFVHRCVALLASVICDNGVNCCFVVRPMGTLGLILG